MASNDQLTGESFELNADLAPLAAQQQANAAVVQSLPVSPTGFVGSLNGQTGNVNINGGTFDGVTYSFTGGAGAINLTVAGLDTLATVKTNIDAAAPTVTDDSDSGYSAFSQWIDNTVPATPDFWVCVDASVGAAIWLKLN